MIARLLISEVFKTKVEEIEKQLVSRSVTKNHPDVLYFNSSAKLGIEQARIIKKHFSLKPYSAKGRVVVLEDASSLTVEAQNALLKTLEEPPADAILLLGASSVAKFLPTVLSRCQIIRVQGKAERVKDHEKEIEKLEKATIEERFEFVEKLKDKEAFLKSLVDYFYQKRDMSFLKELLKAEQLAQRNVNIRAILEYLMLVMPRKLW